MRVLLRTLIESSVPSLTIAITVLRQMESWWATSLIVLKLVVASISSVPAVCVSNGWQFIEAFQREKFSLCGLEVTDTGGNRRESDVTLRNLLATFGDSPEMGNGVDVGTLANNSDKCHCHLKRHQV